MSSQDSGERAGNEAYLVTRPRAVIDCLPPEYRWEFTRRHPYYLLFWEAARHYSQAPDQEPVQRALGKVAATILLMIGVMGEPPDPATPFQDLDSGPMPSTWQSGAVAPMTIRGLAGCFLGLPRSVRQLVAQLLLDANNIADNDQVGMLSLAQRLAQFQDPAFNGSPVAPLLGINLEAPQRAIVQAVEDYVRSEKQSRGIRERRRRDESLPDFLAVWDRREGWTGVTYDGAREHTFLQIGQEIQSPITTVRNRYNTAFHYITGHDYSPELWDRLFGVFKLASIFGDAAPNWISLHRPTRSRQQRDIPMSRLLSDDASLATDATTARANQEGARHADAADLLAEIRSLIGADASNVEIIRLLNMRSERASELIEAIRNRSADLL